MATKQSGIYCDVYMRMGVIPLSFCCKAKHTNENHGFQHCRLDVTMFIFFYLYFSSFFQSLYLLKFLNSFSNNKVISCYFSIWMTSSNKQKQPLKQSEQKMASLFEIRVLRKPLRASQNC